ncbi:MAG: aminotransferase class I/II-fold pyridoxal phosphate-dependent enzyme, partial [Brachybacterium sp.]|nr:aminotransferase class I/II-fold pyridoxal phosphate-dependent enzyme [Brachybacterium sp.]
MTSTRDPQTSPVEDIRPRTVLEGLPAYVPGRPAPDDGKTRYKVSSNESPFPPLAPVAEAVAEAARTANRYPDMAAYALREALAADHGVELSQISVATGSVGVTGDLIRALVDPGDEVVYAWRSFEAYPILVGTHGGTSVQVPLTPAFEHDLDAMADAVTERTKLVLLCTPNNPTGPSLTTAQIQDFVARVPSHVVVAIDEAYREFVDPVRSPDTARLFREHGNVVLLRTFSKLQGIAGLRLGWAVAHPRLA